MMTANIYNCGLIFHFIRLLVIYPFAGSLPTVHYSSVLLILPGQFFFSGMFRKALLDIFRLHILWERIGSLLDEYQHRSYISSKQSLYLLSLP